MGHKGQCTWANTMGSKFWVLWRHLGFVGAKRKQILEMGGGVATKAQYVFWVVRLGLSTGLRFEETVYIASPKPLGKRGGWGGIQAE